MADGWMAKMRWTAVLRSFSSYFANFTTFAAIKSLNILLFWKIQIRFQYVHEIFLTAAPVKKGRLRFRWSFSYKNSIEILLRLFIFKTRKIWLKMVDSSTTCRFLLELVVDVIASKGNDNCLSTEKTRI